MTVERCILSEECDMEKETAPKKNGYSTCPYCLGGIRRVNYVPKDDIWACPRCRMKSSEW